MVAEALRGLRWARGVREAIYLRGRALSLALLLDSIHRSVWKVNSANFRFTEFSEVRLVRECMYY
jgi:hypothetical protein